jgi:hypothetical protein
MFDEDAARPTRFREVVADGLPFAVAADEAPPDGSSSSVVDLEKKTRAYLADEPWHVSMAPDQAKEVLKGFAAAGAKEGHGIGRQAVDVLRLSPPPRRPAAALPRRPVVALLDTVISSHEWIGDDGQDDEGGDAFWRDARHVRSGWRPTDEAGNALAAPSESRDAQATHAGHGTFIAGIIRQLAPDATVLSFPVMDADGFADVRLVRSALRWILERVATADSGDDPGAPARADQSGLAIDVVNLSFGRYLDPGRVPSDEDLTRQLLVQLGDRGVRVVASAGNQGRDDHVFPAAWAGQDTADHTALKSVGALDPDGSVARYSNHGDWVLAAAPGTAVVSCLPRFAADPFWPGVPVPDRQYLALHEDPNLQLSTFARWAGTSFATAVVSGTIAARLADGVGGDLGGTDRASMRRRAAGVWAPFTAMPRPEARREPAPVDDAATP